MTMNHLFKTMFSAILCLWLSGCSLIDFEEDCFYTGDVEVLFDWQKLLEGDNRPDMMQTIFYPDNSALSSYLLTGDTLLTGLAATRHDVLSVNPAENISFHDTDCPCTAYASLRTYTEGSKTYTVNAPALYAAKRDIMILAFERVTCLLEPKPCFQQVFIDFVIIRNNEETEVEALTGELSGIATKYSFGDMQPGGGAASLAFDAKEAQRDKYRTAMRVLGISRNVSNMLDIGLLLDDGRQYAQRLDLSEILAGFTAPAIYLTIEIYLSNAGISLSIADWRLGEGGHIEL